MSSLREGSDSLGEIIDRLISVPVFSGSSLAKKPVVIDLYNAARSKSGSPLSFAAAEKILSASDGADRSIILTTGFIVPPWIEAETDGPVGAVTLAHSLTSAFGLTPIMITEPASVAKLGQLCELGGFRVRDFREATKAPRRLAVEGFTLDREKASEESFRLLGRVKPSAVIAVEKASPNAKGVYHSGIGVDVTTVSSKVDALIEAAQEIGIPTVGIGDAGNEIGMGCVEEAVREILPTGKECGCPCHAGVASSVCTDSLIVCGTSNWGCSAIEAMLSYHFKAPELLHAGSTEEFLIRAAASVGFVDPSSGFSDAGVDAIPAEVHASLINILNFVTRSRYSDLLYMEKYKEYTKDKEKLTRLFREQRGDSP